MFYWCAKINPCPQNRGVNLLQLHLEPSLMLHLRMQPSRQKGMALQPNIHTLLSLQFPDKPRESTTQDPQDAIKFSSAALHAWLKSTVRLCWHSEQCSGRVKTDLQIQSASYMHAFATWSPIWWWSVDNSRWSVSVFLVLHSTPTSRSHCYKSTKSCKSLLPN